MVEDEEEVAAELPVYVCHGGEDASTDKSRRSDSSIHSRYSCILPLMICLLPLRHLH